MLCPDDIEFLTAITASALLTSDNKIHLGFCQPVVFEVTHLIDTAYMTVRSRKRYNSADALTLYQLYAPPK